MLLPDGFSSDLNVAVTTAYAAGNRVMEKYRGNYSISGKNGGSEPVTEADQESNQLIQAALIPLGYPILSEEGPLPAAELTSGKAWIVDPLDGTKDFIDQTDEFTILIGLISDGRAYGGVVYQPATGALYISEFGRGAHKAVKEGWQLLHVSDTDNIASAKLVMSRHHLDESEKYFIASLGISTFMQKGSSGLKLAEIAAGRFDAYFTFTNKIKQWDLCAADCLLTEAGGIMTGLDGNRIKYGSLNIETLNGVLACNGLNLHTKLLSAYKKYVNSR